MDKQAVLTPADAPQTGQSQAQTPVFSKEGLDAMQAPIARYPDALLSQVLMAADEQTAQ